jgi:hypothetical protein
VNVKIGTAKSPTALAIRAVSPGGTAPDDGLRALSPRWGRFVGAVAGYPGGLRFRARNSRLIVSEAPSATMATAYQRRIRSIAIALLFSGLSSGGAWAQKSIFDSPPKRDAPAMIREDQLKLKDDLSAARDRREPNTKAKPLKAQPARPAKP